MFNILQVIFFLAEMETDLFEYMSKMLITLQRLCFSCSLCRCMLNLCDNLTSDVMGYGAPALDGSI